MPELTMTMALHQVCMDVRASEMEQLKMQSPGRREVELDSGQTTALAVRMKSLPQVCRDVLLARYCYRMSTEDIGDIYGIDDPRGEYLYGCQLLGYALELGKDEIISQQSLAAACSALDENISSGIRRDVVDSTIPAFTKKHRRRMNDILQRDGKPGKLHLLMRYAAMFVLVIMLSGVITLSVNAELREKFFNWVVSTYQEFSAFGSTEYVHDPDEIIIPLEPFDHAGLAQETNLCASYAPAFIPEGFELTMDTCMGVICSRVYADQSGREVHITVVNPENGNTLLDTEDAEIKTITLFGQDAFIWNRRDNNFVVLQIDGLQCHIISELDMDTVIKIAQSMKLYENADQAIWDKPMEPSLQQIAGVYPSFIPESISLVSRQLTTQQAFYKYTDEYVQETTMIVRKAKEKDIGDSAIPELTEWQGLSGDYLTWDYGEYTCLMAGIPDMDLMVKMAESMKETASSYIKN